MTHDAVNHWWIGFTDAAVEGTWVWVDGTPTSYTAWETVEATEPNNGGGNEHCATINRFADSGWNDEVCVDLKNYVCEAY